MADNETEPTQFPLEFTVNFDAHDVVKTLTPTEVANLIIELDEEVGEWEVTLRAYLHFRRQYEIALTARPELAHLSEEQLDELLLKLEPEAA